MAEALADDVNCGKRHCGAGLYLSRMTTVRFGVDVARVTTPLLLESVPYGEKSKTLLIG